MSFPAYPTYKDSGSEWIGAIPDHWSASPLKRAFKIEGGSTPTPDEVNWDGDIAWVTPADLSGLSSLFLDVSKRTITATGLASCGSTLLPAGSLILSTRAPIGSLAIALISMCTNQGCKGLVPNANASAVYFAFVLLTAKDELNNRGRGSTFLEISGDELSRFSVPTPPFAEQIKIARFLDHETFRIDALIEEQQRLIELLKEKRQAVISHAVTKGLDSTVPMKDSGVEWLGEVPCSWRVIKFGITHDKAELGGNYEAGESEEGLPLIKMGNIGRGKIKLDKVEYVSLTQDIDNGHTLKEGDFLFNTRNSLDLVGKVCVWRRELQAAFYNSNILRISFNKSLIGSSGFVNYLLNSNLGLEQLRLIARGTTSVAAIYYKDLSSLSFAFPLPSEQLEIERFLDIQTSQLDALVNAAEQAIDLIKERRSALISAAVTGKIDVRGWQPPVSSLTPELVQEAV